MTYFFVWLAELAMVCTDSDGSS